MRRPVLLRFVEVLAEKLDPSSVLDMKVDLADLPKGYAAMGYTPYDQSDGPALVLKEALLS
jgi:hypothetical protein